MEEVDKGCPTIRMGVSGWVFLMLPAYPGSPRPMTVKRLCVCVLSLAWRAYIAVTFGLCFCYNSDTCIWMTCVSKGAPQMAHQKFEEIAPGILSNGTVKWSKSRVCHNRAWCRDFDHFWNNMRESVCMPLKNFQISVQGVWQAQKWQSWGNVKGVLVLSPNLYCFYLEIHCSI